jgi:formate hydrogenlyase subunit 3/multisubunit Na+/H+ antiporter MnhD subunit
MSLLPFLVVTGLGAIAALMLRSRERAATAIGIVGLAAAVVAGLLIRPGQTIEIGGGGLATTDYLRLFVVLGALVALLLAIVGEATGSRRDAPAVALGILATSALALALPDPRIAVLAATAGGAFGALVALTPVGGRLGATVGTRVLRATAVAGTMAIAATAWIGRDLSELAAQPIVFGLAYLAFALAVAIRFGAIPAHSWAARLTDAVPETALPLVTAIAPAALAIVALAWADASVAPLALDLGSVRVVVLAVAIASIFLASLAAWIQDDIEHVVGYAIVGDAGVVMLAIAALDPAAWAPARTWILALIVTRSAFAAWAAATRATFGTGRIAELRGWAVRAPILAVVLGAVVVASIGLPGLAAAEARGALVDLVLDGPIAVVVLLGTLSPLVYYGRLFVLGIERPGTHPRVPWRPVVSGIDLTRPGAWLVRTWSDNRLVSATGGAALLGILALVVSAGAFGAPQAAAGLPPTVGTSTESFGPGEPAPGSDAPSAPASAEPSPEPIQSASPSAEPIQSASSSSEPSGPTTTP